MVVFDGSLDEESCAKEVKTIEEFLKANAEFEATDFWGRRPLAYEINRKRTGYYSLFLYRGDNTVVESLDKSFKFNTSILRHLSVMRDPAKKTAKDIVPDEQGDDKQDDDGDE
jgi:small subunit ribosomal protein S6